MLYIIRGLPGSGKSTLAKNIVGCTGVHVESDMFFFENGQYLFDPKKLKDAHQWCKEQTRVFLDSGRDVAVSNTFTQSWEYKPYIDMADELGVMYQVIDVHAHPSWKNEHGVPEEILQKMKDRWEQHSVK